MIREKIYYDQFFIEFLVFYITQESKYYIHKGENRKKIQSIKKKTKLTSV